MTKQQRGAEGWGGRKSGREPAQVRSGAAVTEERKQPSSSRARGETGTCWCLLEDAGV